MATHALFADSRTFQVQWLPGPFDGVSDASGLKTRFSMDRLTLANSTLQRAIKELTPNSKFISINGFLIQALLLNSFNSTSLVDPDHRYSLFKVSNTDELAWFLCEYDGDDGTVLVDYQFNKTTQKGKLRGVKIVNGSSFVSLGSAQKGEYPYPMAAVYLPVLHAMSNTVFELAKAEAMNALVEIYVQNKPLDNSRLEILAAFSHIFYALVEQDTVVVTKGVTRFPVPFTAGSISVLPAKEINSGIYSDAVNLFGPGKFFSDGSSSARSNTAAKKPTVAALKDEFKDFNKLFQWTEEERLLIPQFPDDFIVPEETLEFARAYVKTRNMDTPMVNFMWRGKTSYGKTTGVKLMACILDRPLLRQTCFPSMETQDFLSAYVPDNGPALTGWIPTVEDMYLDPVSAYQQMTGIEKEDVTAQDCLDEVCKRAASSNGAARFKHVKANYVKALSRGYIIELSEVSRIREPGVLVGLDDFDQPGAIIPLVDGSYARRHRDAIVVMTDNVGYVSCRPVDPAVLRRMAFILDTDTMPKAKVIARIKTNTGFKDTALLNLMYKTWNAVAEYCETHEINEGSVSLTELERWTQKVMIDGNDTLYENCVKCIVNKATNVREEQNEIRTAVLDLHLSNIHT